MESLTSAGKDFNLRVSSTLNRDAKQFGKRNMFDDNCDTCWNSDHGSPQFVALEFPKPVSVRELRIRFQGGFAGRDCLFQIGGGRSQEMSKEISFHPKDSNNLQCFPMETETYHTSYKILFLSSTDLYGRITIYQMEMIGMISK
ncbi:PREDICTED: nuclear receptor 2C2-associated protein-like isoform X1 [Amphimedon queenslandica]|uniref:DOC domain-containing protein n=1 Tax=Amphimedon queenslandica TaxID=400682 RepID=A0A1X7UUA8_AMPQE|nr:PREDICTED: nuclear receptor 2C2-associated protein-like isoform X1 [Amphimedon queenslandica]|eukprot:XP_019852300.1 PREDICTED: nuclear receptor 2C2-associated protein-like isoform X1 [Amphimedon queenslandica]